MNAAQRERLLGRAEQRRAQPPPRDPVRAWEVEKADLEANLQEFAPHLLPLFRQCQSWLWQMYMNGWYQRGRLLEAQR